MSSGVRTPGRFFRAAGRSWSCKELRGLRVLGFVCFGLVLLAYGFDEGGSREFRI